MTWYCHIQQIPMRSLQVVQQVRVYYSGVQAFVSQTLCILFGCWCTSEFFTSIPAESFWFSFENHHKRTTFFHREHYRWNV